MRVCSIEDVWVEMCGVRVCGIKGVGDVWDEGGWRVCGVESAWMVCVCGVGMCGVEGVSAGKVRLEEGYSSPIPCHISLTIL